MVLSTWYLFRSFACKSMFGDWWFFTILKENILWNLYFKEHLTNTFITILISLFPNKEKLCFFITQTSWFPRTPTSVQLIQKTMFHLRSLQPNAVFWEEHTSELIVVFSTFDFSFLFRTTREFAWLMPTDSELFRLILRLLRQNCFDTKSKTF